MENNEIGIQLYFSTFFEILSEATFEEIGIIYEKASQEIFDLEEKNFGEIEKDPFIEFEIKEIIKEQEYTIKRVLRNQELKKKRKDDDNDNDDDNDRTEITETNITEEYNQNDEYNEVNDDDIIDIEIYGENGNILGIANVSERNKLNVPPSEYFHNNCTETETKEIIILGNEDEWNHTINFYEAKWEEESFAKFEQEEKEKEKQNAEEQWKDMGMDEIIMSPFSNEMLPE